MVNFTIQAIDGKLWAFTEPPCGDPEEVPINEWLKWVLEQFNFGNWDTEVNDEGHVTSMTFGLPSAVSADGQTPDEVAEQVKKRMTSVQVAKIFARGREEGVEPEHAALSEEVRMTAGARGYQLTELHYAFELIQILKRIRKDTFVFAALPIHGVANKEVLELLREATRAFMFDLRWSCVSLCRAIIDAALKSRVDRTKVLEEVWKSKKGDLEAMIVVAQRGHPPLLTAEQAKQADHIRRTGNKALHNQTLLEEDVWVVLVDTRSLVEAIYA